MLPEERKYQNIVNADLSGNINFISLVTYLSSCGIIDNSWCIAKHADINFRLVKPILPCPLKHPDFELILTGTVIFCYFFLLLILGTC
jgi:hypothetical protein